MPDYKPRKIPRELRTPSAAEPAEAEDWLGREWQFPGNEAVRARAETALWAIRLARRQSAVRDVLETAASESDRRE